MNRLQLMWSWNQRRLKWMVGGLVFTFGTLLWAEPPLEVTGTLRQTIDEDAHPRAFHMVLQSQDADGDAVDWSVYTPAAHGKAAVSGSGRSRTIQYQPDPDWHGEDRFTLLLDDGLGGQSHLDVVVTVRPQNDAPQNTTSPFLSGIPAVGEELKVDVGEWDDSRDGLPGDFDYAVQWQLAKDSASKDAQILEGESTDTLLLREDWDGMYVRSVVTATERGDGGLSAPRAVTPFFKVGNSMPAFVLVAPLQTMPTHHPSPDEATVEVDRIVFTGNDSIPSEELEPLVSRFTSRAVTLTELKYAAGEITAEYRRRGMILAKAYLPAQEVDDGVVSMQILEGRRGELTVEGTSSYSEEFVRRHLEKAMSSEVVSNRELESGLLMMNEEYPGLLVQAVLQPGQSPGTVGIHAVVEEKKTWGLRLGYNNFGSDSISRHRFVVGGNAHNLLLDGDLFSLEGVMAEHPEDLANWSTRYSIPVNYHGTRVGVQAAAGYFEVGKQFEDLGIQGDSQSMGVFIKHPFLKSRELRLAGEFGIHAENAKYKILDEIVSEDRVRTAYLSLYASGRHRRGTTSGILNLTQGLKGFANGTSEDSDKASRQGGDTDFTRLTLSAARRQNLNTYAALQLRVSGQINNDTMLASQEWQIGGVDSVRGATPAEAVGDKGVNASAEFQIFPFKGHPHQFVMFADYGYVFRDDTLVNEPNETSLSGAGLGVRYFLNTPYAEGLLRCDVGWSIEPEENVTDENPVVYFSTEFKF